MRSRRHGQGRGGGRRGRQQRAHSPMRSTPPLLVRTLCGEQRELLGTLSRRGKRLPSAGTPGAAGADLEPVDPQRPARALAVADADAGPLAPADAFAGGQPECRQLRTRGRCHWVSPARRRSRPRPAILRHPHQHQIMGLARTRTPRYLAVSEARPVLRSLPPGQVGRCMPGLPLDLPLAAGQLLHAAEAHADLGVLGQPKHARLDGLILAAPATGGPVGSGGSVPSIVMDMQALSRRHAGARARRGVGHRRASVA